ncbi:hypothetical protein ACOTVE_09100, partial [Campylobacter jejuni]|uniref:hypothetical protein n=1 Tax=Campylobacter jejuni TaxID=197 RepID=UPI003B9F0EE4
MELPEPQLIDFLEDEIPKLNEDCRAYIKIYVDADHFWIQELTAGFLEEHQEYTKRLDYLLDHIFTGRPNNRGFESFYDVLVNRYTAFVTRHYATQKDTGPHIVEFWIPYLNFFRNYLRKKPVKPFLKEIKSKVPE